MVSIGQWGLRESCQVACKLTLSLSPFSLLQALLTVLSQVLHFLAIEWYLPLLVSSLVLGWLNLLYYTRGFQYTGIYSVMIQKVRDWAGRGTTLQWDSFGLSSQVTPSTTHLGRREHEYVHRVPRHSLNVSKSVSMHIPALRGLRSAYVSKYLHLCVCKCPHGSTCMLAHGRSRDYAHKLIICLEIWA